MESVYSEIQHAEEKHNDNQYNGILNEGKYRVNFCGAVPKVMHNQFCTIHGHCGDGKQ